jgi:hypothetical protein
LPNFRTSGVAANVTVALEADVSALNGQSIDGAILQYNATMHPPGSSQLMMVTAFNANGIQAF